MKLQQLKTQLKQQFKLSNVDACDVDFIIAETLNVARTGLIFVDEISANQHKKIMRAVGLRLAGMPVDKIFKKAYFCGLTFKVNKSVLSPRQDSEVLVEKAVEIIGRNQLKTMLDLCTGSGCLAVAINKRTNIKTTATDVSMRAIKIAEQNAQTNKAKVNFVKSNMFKNIHQKFDLIVSNPPYIPSKDIAALDAEVKNYDPIKALDGGLDGLKFYKIIAKNAKSHLNKHGYIVLEIGFNQQQQVKAIFSDYNFVECAKDLGGNDRVMIFKI